MDEFSPENTIERMLLHRASSAQRPVTGTLELLPLCNMNCGMCYVRRTPAEVKAGGGLHSASEWLALGKELQASGVLFLLLTGGEPLLFPGFRKVYSGLRELGMLLTVNTNGTLIDEDWADFFAKHPPRRINITLYGSSEESYASLCHYSGGFAKTMRGIRLLKERGVQVKLNASATNQNCADFEDIYRIGAELEIPVTTDTYMIPALRERGLPFEMQSRLLPEAAAQAHWKVLQHDMAPEILHAHSSRLLAQMESPEPCHYPDCVTCLASNCSFAIDWRGQMRPCVTLEEPAVPVFEVGFEEAWKQISQETKRLQMNAKCASCRLRPLCPTCVGSAWLETGSYDGVPEYLCRYSEELYRIMKEVTAGVGHPQENCSAPDKDKSEVQP